MTRDDRPGTRARRGARTRPNARGPRTRPNDWLARARAELRRVHAQELARLLRLAVRRRCDPGARDARDDQDDQDDRGRANEPARAPRGRWAAALRTELAGWRADGLDLPRALREARTDWTSAFARAALELDPCGESELCLALALVRRGRQREARARFARALAGRLPSSRRGRAEAGLAARALR